MGRKENGSGTIYQDKDGKWVGELRWVDSAGNKQRKRFKSSKKIETSSKMKEFKRELILKSGKVENTDILFCEYAEYWTGIIKQKMKPSSFQRKLVSLENQVYPFIGNIPISNITITDVQNMVNELRKQGLSYSTIKKAYEAVSGCLKFYRIQTQSNIVNPCEGVVLPENIKRESSDILCFNENERTLIINEALRKYSNGKNVYRLGYIIVLLMYTGMRISEAIALTWDDIDFEKRTISIDKDAVVVKIDGKYTILNQKSPKTHSGNRIIPMTKMAYDMLVEIHNITGNCTYVMSTKNNRQISPRNINRMFHSILTQTGLYNKFAVCGVHSLRHTFASMLFDSGCEVKTVSELLGHSDTHITENIYIHIIHRQKVMAIEKLK